MEETSSAVKNIAARKEAAEDLCVVRVQPLAAKLEGVPAVDDGNVVAGAQAECRVRSGRGISFEWRRT